jgi:hypothetical protein
LVPSGRKFYEILIEVILGPLDWGSVHHKISTYTEKHKITLKKLINIHPQIWIQTGNLMTQHTSDRATIKYAANQTKPNQTKLTNQPINQLQEHSPS